MKTEALDKRYPGAGLVIAGVVSFFLWVAVILAVQAILHV